MTSGPPSPARPLLAALAAAALLPLLAWTAFTPFYLTNDDVAMRLLAEGRFVPDGRPVPFLLFVNVLLGKLLTWGYGLLPAVPWYDLLMGASTAAAAAALFAVWIGPGRWREVAWALLLGLFFLLPLFIVVQFSLAGLACAAAGLALLARAAAEPLPKSRGPLVLGAGLFAWGGLIRFEGAVLIAIEGAALALPLAVAAWRESRRRLRGAVLAAAAGVVLLGLSIAVNQAAYARTPGWREFYEYNLLRARLSEYMAADRATPEAVAALRERTGWSGNDLTLFQQWFFTDPEVYSLPKVREAVRLFYGDDLETPRPLRAGQAVETARRFLADAWPAFLLMAAFVLAHGGRRPGLYLYFLGASVLVVLLVVGIGLALKEAPHRIFWPMLILEAALLAVAARRWGGGEYLAQSALAIPAALGAAFLLLRTVLPLQGAGEKHQAGSAAAVRDVAGLTRTGTVLAVLHADTFPLEYYWQPFRQEAEPFPFVGLGASARTPPIQGFLRRTGRTDLPLSLCTEPGLLLIAREGVLPFVATFLREHHGLDVAFAPAFTGERFTAWRCQRAGSATLTP